MSQSDLILFDAGMFIGALLQGDGRHSEARPLVEAARAGRIGGCTTTGILSEVYAALTWIGAQPTHTPEEAADAVRSFIETPSQIQVLASGLKASLKMLDLAKKYGLKARRTHDARHAAIALEAGITKVYTYDAGDWKALYKKLLDTCSISSMNPRFNALALSGRLKFTMREYRVAEDRWQAAREKIKNERPHFPV